VEGYVDSRKMAENGLKWSRIVGNECWEFGVDKERMDCCFISCNVSISKEVGRCSQASLMSRYLAGRGRSMRSSVVG
jgi:hypothetical protein